MTPLCNYSALGSALDSSPSAASTFGLAAFGLGPLAASSAMRLFLPFGSSSTSFAGARIFTLPPAFSTAAMADFEARNTAKSTLLLSSPSPSSFTPPLARRIRPALTMAAASIGFLVSMSPASIAACTLPILVSLSRTANDVLRKPRLGRRRCSGIWPPSKPLMRTPERAVWPLPPRPPVLPMPEPMPRPMRKRFLRAPGRSAISLSFIAVVLLTRVADHAHQMPQLADHAARRWRIRQVAGATDLVESEPDQGLALVMVTPRGARHLLDLDGFCLGHTRDP